MQTDLNLFGVSANLPLSYVDDEPTLSTKIQEFQQGQIRYKQPGGGTVQTKIFSFKPQFGSKRHALSKSVESNLDQIIHSDLGPNAPYGNEAHITKAAIAQSDAWEAIKTLIGTIDGPSDWASEHDHYIYGVPKRR